MRDLAPVLGVAAALIGLADMAPYVRDTVRRSTRPHRGTWLIWTVLAVVVSLSQHADGGSWSVAMAVAQAVTNGLVLALAIRLGTGGVSALDLTLISIAGAGVAGWLLAGDPLVATACVIAADLIAAAMMVPKAWRDPRSETLSMFAWASVAGALSAAAVAAPEPSLLLYPAYYCLVNGGLALLIGGRRVTTRAGLGPGRMAASRRCTSPIVTRRPVLQSRTFHTTLTTIIRQNATSTPGDSARFTSVELSEKATTRPMTGHSSGPA